MLVNRVGGGSENLKVELTEQESLLAQIQEILPFKGVSADLNSIVQALGYTKVAVDKFSLENPTSVPKIPHSLNEIPSAFLVIANFGSVANNYVSAVYRRRGDKYFNVFFVSGTAELCDTATLTGSYTSTQISIGSANTHQFQAGVEYTVITLA